MADIDWEAAADQASAAGCTGTSREEVRACTVAAAEAAATAGCAAYPVTAPIAPLCGTIAGEIAGPLFDAVAGMLDELFGDTEGALHEQQNAAWDAFSAALCSVELARRAAQSALDQLVDAAVLRDPKTGMLRTPPSDLAPSGWERGPYAWIIDELGAAGAPVQLGDPYRAVSPVTIGLPLFQPIAASVGAAVVGCSDPSDPYHGAIYHGASVDAIAAGAWQQPAQNALDALQAWLAKFKDVGMRLLVVRTAAMAAEKAHAEAQLPEEPDEQGPEQPPPDGGPSGRSGMGTAITIAAAAALGLLLIRSRS